MIRVLDRWFPNRTLVATESERVLNRATEIAEAGMQELRVQIGLLKMSRNKEDRQVGALLEKWLKDEMRQKEATQNG